MTADKINQIRQAVCSLEPLVHCITNPISINQCANALIAAGARPIMAEHPDEVREITQTAQALMLNLGNITDTRMKSILLCAKAATENAIPFIIDLVGVACSPLRRGFAHSLLKQTSPTAIKGNYSEINALYNSEYRCAGVDAENTLRAQYVTDISVRLARKYNTIILASGKTDIVTDGKMLIHIKNGSFQLSKVTGTGCMLGAICACYLSVCQDANAIAAACAVFGICGELAETDKGNGSFMVNLIDSLSVLTYADVKKYIKTEETKIETI